MDWLQWIGYIIVTSLVIKTVIGFRFPWERCNCCGKKIREHEGFSKDYRKKS
jgi:hypothetical protein